MAGWKDNEPVDAMESQQVLKWEVLMDEYLVVEKVYPQVKG